MHTFRYEGNSHIMLINAAKVLRIFVFSPYSSCDVRGSIDPPRAARFFLLRVAACAFAVPGYRLESLWEVKLPPHGSPPFCRVGKRLPLLDYGMLYHFCFGRNGTFCCGDRHERGRDKRRGCCAQAAKERRVDGEHFELCRRGVHGQGQEKALHPFRPPSPCALLPALHVTPAPPHSCATFAPRLLSYPYSFFRNETVSLRGSQALGVAAGDIGRFARGPVWCRGGSESSRGRKRVVILRQNLLGAGELGCRRDFFSRESATS